jgi:hypothetical protein
LHLSFKKNWTFDIFKVVAILIGISIKELRTVLTIQGGRIRPLHNLVDARNTAVFVVNSECRWSYAFVANIEWGGTRVSQRK